MKKVFLPILLLHLAAVVNAATYYFSSSSGDDSRTSAQAQNPLTPWSSITKLNSITSSLKPGDQVLFKRGETFNGGISIAVSGSSTAPIFFGAYGTGNKPVISGFSVLWGWKQVSGNIWECPFWQPSGKENMVINNGKQLAIGRYPNLNESNKGYLTINSHSGMTEITSNQLTSSTNWTGAEISIRKNHWVLDHSAITYQYGSTIGFVSGSSNPISDNFGFFIQNSPNTLDQDGEWWYDKSRSKMRMYFNTSNPNANYYMRASTVEIMVNLSFARYITFDNLSIQGANQYTFNLTNSDYITVNACDISYTGTDAVKALSSGYFSFTNNTINRTNNDGLNMYWNCSNAVISGNTIKNTGLIAGMSQNSANTHQGIFILGNNNLIQYNEVDSTGHNGIHFEGDYSTAQYNFVNAFGLTVDDCGGIYTGQGLGDLTVYKSKSILNNIVVNGKGSYAGTSDDSTYIASQGIYLDANTNHVLVSGNTLAYSGQAGIFANEGNDNTITNNTMFDNTYQQFYGCKKASQSNITVTNNIMFSKTVKELGNKLSSYTGSNDIAQFGSLNNNYYCRPIDDGYLFYSQYKIGSAYTTSYDNLATWASKFGFDKNSKGAPGTIPANIYGSLSGVNKYTNGSYNSSVGDVGTYSTAGDMVKTWVANKLDAGTMQVASNAYSSGNRYMMTLPLNSAVTNGKGYVLSLSLQGAAAGRPMDVYMRTQASGNADITTRTKIPIDVNRQDVQIGLTASATAASAAIELDVSDPNGAVWIDNVNLQEATVTPTNPDDYIVFQYNASQSVKSFSVNGTYYDAKGTAYSGNITLQPYASLVLFKQGSSTSTFKTTSDAQAIKLQGNMTDASPASLTASSATVNWQVKHQSSTASYYTIEKSTDNASFTNISKTEVKEENIPVINYQYSDNRPAFGKNWYRITQYDKKGTAITSEVIMVNNISFSVNPNPVQSTMHLFFNGMLKAGDHVSKDIVIRSLSGATVKTLQLPSTDNISSANFDASSLPAGLYTLSITSEGKTISKQFLKQ